MKLSKKASPNFKTFKFEFYNYRVFILKKALNIIYKLNINNKRVLFIGIAAKYSGILNYIKLRTNHCFIKNHFWLNGLFSNKIVINYLSLSGNFIYFRNLGLKPSFSLAVIFNKLTFKKEIIRSNFLAVISTNHGISKYFSYNVNKKTNSYLLILLIYLIIQTT